jgi:ribose transport system ATP-binding protein
MSSLAETTREVTDASPPGTTILELRGLDKQYTGTHALRHVDLAFQSGEIHAIVGENGAGKSTLIKLLTGAVRRSAGEIVWQGRTVEIDTPHDAIALGINAVHQEVVLCRHLTVAANLFLGDERMRRGLLRHRDMEREAQKILDEIGFDIRAGVLLSSLTIGQQQLVATARAAMRGTKFLIFDEPTAYLTRQESAQLFALIRRLKAAGVTIVYISHRLEEVFDLSDRVSILRDGQLVGTMLTHETDEAAIIHGMINRSIEQVFHKDDVPHGHVILQTRALSGDGFRDISLTVAEGEIVGLYGLIGAGRSEFVHALFGRSPARSGEIIWNGKPVVIRNERAALNLGIALAPESRRDQGLALSMPVGFNLNLPILRRLSTGPLLSGRAQATHAERQISDLQIKTASRHAPASSLSGGNQQKIVIGKWLNHGAKLFIFDEPTVGVDVGTKAEIYQLMGTLLQQGAGIILISSYLPEVYELADTLHVFRRGELVATHGHKTASHADVLSAAIGV